MKKTLLSLCFIAASISSASAATLIADNYDSGLTLADGTTALANGRVRFGIFTISDSAIIANANDVSFLDTNFRAVVDYSGSISAFSTPGFFDAGTFGASGIYAGGSTAYGGTTYDLSSGTTSNVANDIAGSNIYMWVLNNATLGSATQQAIFASNFTWADTDLQPDNNSSYSTAAANNTALFGTLGTGADIGSGANSHSLATIGAVPEPSRALLGLIGLSSLLFRRRRA